MTPTPEPATIYALIVNGGSLPVEVSWHPRKFGELDPGEQVWRATITYEEIASCE